MSIAAALADALYDLLHARAHSIGLLDIKLDSDDRHVDVEVCFDRDPDMGLSFDIETGSCRFCELVDFDAERWLDEGLDGIELPATGDDAAFEAVALRVLRALLDARRELQRT